MVKIRRSCRLCSLHLCAGGLELLHFSELVYPVFLYVRELCSVESVAALYFLF